MNDHPDHEWKLFSRALDIIEGRANGHAMPIIRKLARRRFAPAVSVLSDYVSDARAIRLLRQEARRGDPTCAYNLAITHRNQGDLRSYRLALAQAAKIDPDAAAELRRFRVRFPNEVMRRFHRLAPDSD